MCDACPAKVLTIAALLVAHSPKLETQLCKYPIVQETTNSYVDGSEPLVKKQKTSTQVEASAGIATRRIAEVIVNDPSEAAAAEDCLQYAHSSRLPSQVPHLLRMFQMADFLDMQLCCEAVVKAMLVLKRTEIEVGSAVLLTHAGYGGILQGHVHGPQLRSLFLGALLHHLGDVVAVMRSEDLKAQWLSLPHAALLELLASEQLATDSEDSVVAAVSSWADHNKPNTAAKQQLLNALRLIQLSSNYLYSVVPKLAWLQDGMLAWGPSLWRLAAYAAGDAIAKIQIQKSGDATSNPSRLPAAWTNTALRPVTKANGQGGAVAYLKSSYVTYSLLQQELLPKLQPCAQQAETAEHHNVRIPETLFAHGYRVGMLVKLRSAGKLALKVCAGVPAVLSTQSPDLPAWRLRFQFHCQSTSDLPSQYSITKPSKPFDGVATQGAGLGYYVFTFPENKPITDIESWNQLLLVGGALHVKVELQATGKRLL